MLTTVKSFQPSIVLFLNPTLGLVLDLLATSQNLMLAQQETSHFQLLNHKDSQVWVIFGEPSNPLF